MILSALLWAFMDRKHCIISVPQLFPFKTWRNIRGLLSSWRWGKGGGRPFQEGSVFQATTMDATSKRFIGQKTHWQRLIIVFLISIPDFSRLLHEFFPILSCNNIQVFHGQKEQKKRGPFPTPKTHGALRTWEKQDLQGMQASYPRNPQEASGGFWFSRLVVLLFSLFLCSMTLSGEIVPFYCNLWHWMSK